MVVRKSKHLKAWYPCPSCFIGYSW